MEAHKPPIIARHMGLESFRIRVGSRHCGSLGSAFNQEFFAGICFGALVADIAFFDIRYFLADDLCCASNLRSLWKIECTSTNTA